MVREVLARALWTMALRIRAERFAEESDGEAEGGGEADKMAYSFDMAKGQIGDLVDRIDADEASWEWHKAEGEKNDKPKTAGKKKEDRPKTDGKRKEDKHKAAGVKKVDKNSSPAASAARAAAMRRVERKRGGQT